MTKKQSPQQDVKSSCDSRPTLRATDASRSQDAETADTRGTKGRVPQSLRRLVCLSVTRRTHSTELVGELAPEAPLDVARTVYDTDRVTEAMVLSTCNRVEVYVSARTSEFGDRETVLETATDALALPPETRVYTGRDVATHLARVTAGIESTVLGEDEIAGQVSDALSTAKEAGLAAGVLGRVGTAAMRAGRKCRAETAIDEGPAGYGSAVCRVLAKDLDDPPRRVLIIGAGQMASTVARSVRRRWEARIDVANRSPAHELTTEDGTWWPLDELGAALGEADAVVTATGGDHHVFEKSHANQCEDRVPIVDLATPPDVAPDARNHPGINVTDLAELAAVVRTTTDCRRAAVTEAENVIGDAVNRLVERERENRAEDVIRELHREAATVREVELNLAKQRLADGEADPDEVLEDFSSALIASLLGPATDELRTAARKRDESALKATRRLFDLDDSEKT